MLTYQSWCQQATGDVIQCDYQHMNCVGESDQLMAEQLATEVQASVDGAFGAPYRLGPRVRLCGKVEDRVSWTRPSG